MLSLIAVAGYDTVFTTITGWFAFPGYARARFHGDRMAEIGVKSQLKSQRLDCADVWARWAIH